MSAPTVNEPEGTSAAPTPSTSASATADRNCTNGKYVATSRCAATLERRYDSPSSWKSRHGGRLVHERLRLAHAGQALLEVGIDGSDPVTGQVVETGRATTEPYGGGGERDHHAQGDETKLDVDDDERDADADEGHESDQRVEQPVLDERLELVDVSRHPAS